MRSIKDGNSRKRIIFIGGHHTSAVVVIKRILKERKDIEIYWIGHKYSAWKDRNPSLEFSDIALLNIPFYNLYAGKIYNIYNPIRLLRVPFGFVQAMYFLVKIRPRLVVSFGGYLSVPVVFCSWILRVPVITHEQTLHSGWANMFVSKFARRILLTWESSKEFFPSNKSVVIGLPMSEEHGDSNFAGFDNDLPLVFVTGGKQGSHIINVTILSILEELLKKVNLIVQTGDNSYYQDFSRFERRISKLGVTFKERVILRKYLSRGDQLFAIRMATLLIGRAGAHFTYEVCFFKKPCILIPLPNTSHDEQGKNALFVKDLGLGQVVLQKDLEPKKLLELIFSMLSNIAGFKLKEKVSLPVDAAQKFTQEIYKYV